MGCAGRQGGRKAKKGTRINCTGCGYPYRESRMHNCNCPRQFSGQARNSISRYLSYSTLHTSSSLSRTMHVPQSNGPRPSHSINHHRVWYVMYVLRQQLTLLWSTLIYSATQPAARGGILRVVLISDGYKDESTNPRWRRHLFNCN